MTQMSNTVEPVFVLTPEHGKEAICVKLHFTRGSPMPCRSDKEYRGVWETIHNILRTKLSPQRKARSAMHILL